MEQIATVDSVRRPHGWNLDRLFGAASKDTVIRLRWPLVILSSYLLYYTPSEWLTPAQIQALLAVYLLSHSTLYFLADDLFDSPDFYAPLLIFRAVPRRLRARSNRQTPALVPTRSASSATRSSWRAPSVPG